jgi:hypothetical protein
MCACVLAANGQILACTTYSPLSVADHNSESIKKWQLEFDESIKTEFGNPDVFRYLLVTLMNFSLIWMT